MGLSRQEESFQRPYSAPEPPKRARRPKLLALLIALVSFVAAAVAVFVLAPGGGERQVARPPEPSAGGSGPGPSGGGPAPSPAPSSSSASPSRTAAPPEQAAPLYKVLPKPCGMVRKGTVERLVPKAQQQASGDSTYGTCTYTSASSSDGFRSQWLRVEGRLYKAGGAGAPERAAGDDVAAHWKAAHDATLERTVRLERRSGIGDEAYAWFKVDRGQPTAVGQITARVGNVVITVSYSEQVTGKAKAEDRERTCLGNATGAAREVLAALA
ncbi:MULTISPECIES: hypothetical protein [Thermomonosporaceae]|uniref:hypothetical protein n=1 Tax=Thermomonosporaceae TaxID=2012 RepID=UPI00255A9B9C|nr:MULTISPECIES: hypothetical protein [Thermomonosporaceae]MDL4775607.1 hypothetical protein [Actinomadura xylanilytica]